jgi:TolA-binding protein
MTEKILEHLKSQQQTLLELEDELEIEISRVIALKNSISPELIEEIEKIEEGLYVEVKMIHETKKNIDSILTEVENLSLSDDDSTKNKDLKDIKADVDKYKKRSEKLAKQLIQANDEIEELTNKMEENLKERENKLKNEFINKLKDKDQGLNEKLMEAQRREENLLEELEIIKSQQKQLEQQDQDTQDPENLERVRNFFEKKIKNLKKTMSEEFSQREKAIAEKAIVVYNKKKEKIYNSAIKQVLSMPTQPPEVEELLGSLRENLNLSEDVYTSENFFLCEDCGEVIHISNPTCPNCNAKYEI